MGLLHGLTKVMRRDGRKYTGTLFRKRGVADEARAAERVADEVNEVGKDILESERSGIGFDSIQKGRTADTRADGGATGWRGVVDVVNEEEILLWGLDDNKAGVGRGVEHKACVEHHRRSVGLVIDRKWQSAESLCDTNANSDMAQGVGRNKEKAGFDAMRVIWSRFRVVGVWVACGGSNTGHGDVEEIGGVAEIGIGEWGELVASLDEEEVGNGLGLTNAEKVDEEGVGLVGGDEVSKGRRSRTGHDDGAVWRWKSRRRSELVGAAFVIYVRFDAKLSDNVWNDSAGAGGPLGEVLQ